MRLTSRPAYFWWRRKEHTLPSESENRREPKEVGLRLDDRMPINDDPGMTENPAIHPVEADD
jgi:hypothetical protein